MSCMVSTSSLKGKRETIKCHSSRDGALQGPQQDLEGAVAKSLRMGRYRRRWKAGEDPQGGEGLQHSGSRGSEG